MVKLPFNDETMTYDSNNHRYILTENGVFNELGVNLSVELNSTNDVNPSNLPARILNQVSLSAYNWLYQNSANNEWQEYILAKTPSIRRHIKTAMQAQLLYVLANGFIGQHSGINVAKASIMDIDKLRGRAKVAEEVEHLGNRMIPEVGTCLLYAGIVPFYPRYEEMGY